MPTSRSSRGRARFTTRSLKKPVASRKKISNSNSRKSSRKSSSSRSRKVSKSTSRSRKVSKSTSRSRKTSRSSSRSRKTSRSSSRSRKTSRSSSRSRKTSKSRSRSRKTSKSRSRSSSRKKAVKKKRYRKYLENPLEPEKHFSQHYWELQEELRQKLPASQPEVKKEFFKILDKNDIILLTADTGAGKSTQIPKLVYEYLEYNATVICTQPTKINAQGISQRVAEELDVTWGHKVGFYYQGAEKEYKAIRTRYDWDDPAEDWPEERGKIKPFLGLNRLMFVTDGSFVNDILDNPSFLLTLGALIIDEAHIRNVNMDLIMYFMKKALEVNVPHIRPKFIIMSATVEKEIFMNYYKKAGIYHYHIPGRAHPVEAIYTKQPIYNRDEPRQVKKAMYSEVQRIIIEIFKNNKGKPPGDILVFFSSIRNIKEMQRKLEEILPKEGVKNFKVIPAYAKIVGYGDENKKITEPIPGITKIVLSTDVAETGITINGVYYVIDSGLSQSSSYDPVEQVQTLDNNFISKSSANQRMGRAGRMQPGKCYRLYTKDEYEAFPASRKVPIQTDNIDRFLLKLLVLRNNMPEGPIPLVKEMLRDFISPPDPKVVQVYLDRFKKLKMFERDTMLEKTILNTLGECLALSEMDLDLLMAFLSGWNYEIEPMILCDLIAIISLGTNWRDWFRFTPLPEEFRKHYVNPFGDLIGLYYIYLDYSEDKLPREYRNYLNLSLFKEIEETSKELCYSSLVTGSNECIDEFKPKYRVRRDMLKNIVANFQQIYSHQKISKSELNMKMIQRGGINFYDFKSEQLIYLSKIILSDFGQNHRPIYGNFLNAELIKS